METVFFFQDTPRCFFREFSRTVSECQTIWHGNQDTNHKHIKITLLSLLMNWSHKLKTQWIETTCHAILLNALSTGIWLKQFRFRMDWRESNYYYCCILNVAQSHVHLNTGTFTVRNKTESLLSHLWEKLNWFVSNVCINIHILRIHRSVHCH